MPEEWWRTLDPRRLRVAVLASFLALPVLVLDNLPTRSNSAEAVETADADIDGEADVPTTSTIRVATTAVPTTAPAPTAPTTAAPTTTAPPRTTTTAPRVSTPTTTAPAAAVQAAAPPTTTVAPAAPPGNVESGKATWYHWNPGECAHKTLPRGTVVTVTAVESGLTTTCTVTDRGPYGAGRIIDLDSTVFDDLAGLGAGVIDVVITW